MVFFSLLVVAFFGAMGAAARLLALGRNRTSHRRIVPIGNARHQPFGFDPDRRGGRRPLVTQWRFLPRSPWSDHGFSWRLYDGVLIFAPDPQSLAIRRAAKRSVEHFCVACAVHRRDASGIRDCPGSDELKNEAKDSNLLRDCCRRSPGLGCKMVSVRSCSRQLWTIIPVGNIHRQCAWLISDWALFHDYRQ